jgi:uncharacterized protein
LLKVPKLGPKAFEQCAGFLRINDGNNPLDGTSVHPESYEAAEKLLAMIGYDVNNLKELQAKAKEADALKEQTIKEQKQPRRNRNEREDKKIKLQNSNSAMGQLLLSAIKDAGGVTDATKEKENKNDTNMVSAPESISHLSQKIKDKKKVAQELGIGEITLTDIIKELEKPSRDPREEMPKPILRTDVLDMKDLTEGMILKGTVRNVIDFGAFVDIGVHQDGLVHISQMSKQKFVKHPLDIVSVGDIVEVKVLSVDVAKKRIQLSMIL